MKFSYLIIAAILASMFLISFASADCVDNQRILRLSASTNAHAELYNAGAYSTQICYDEIFGLAYTNSPQHPAACANPIVRLIVSTNSHAELPNFANPLGNYPINVCYGDLACRPTQGSCILAERFISSLASQTNSHLSSFNAYSNRICCSSVFANPPSCGDNICQLNENSANCPQDCSSNPICGDSNIDLSLNEVCDGNNFGSQTCQTNGYPLGGSLSCINNCQTISLAGCTPNPVCDNDNTCDAGETNANCPSDCPIVPPVCDNDNTCDAGETNANCPSDCPITSGGLTITTPITNPSFPIFNNGTAQPVTVSFTATSTNGNPYPLLITFNLLDSQNNIVNTQIISSSSNLPVIYTIPGGLSNGVFTLRMTIVDTFGDTIIYTFGTITVTNIIPPACDNDNTCDAGETNANCPADCHGDNDDGNGGGGNNNDNEDGIKRLPDLDWRSFITGAATDEDAESGSKLITNDKLTLIGRLWVFLFGLGWMFIWLLILLILLLLLLILLLAGRRRKSAAPKKDSYQPLPQKDAKK